LNSFANEAAESGAGASEEEEEADAGPAPLEEEEEEEEDAAEPDCACEAAAGTSAAACCFSAAAEFDARLECLPFAANDCGTGTGGGAMLRERERVVREDDMAGRREREEKEAGDGQL
jgi:hypothetical protein